MWRNKISVANKLEMSIKKGKLLVNNSEVQPGIQILDTHKLLYLQKDEILELPKLDVSAGIPVVERSSQFQGYIADVQNFEDLNRAYE